VLFYIAFVVCGHSFQPADGDRFFFDTDPAARRFTGTVASPAEDARKNIGFPVDHVSFSESFCGDESDILRYRSVCGAGVLAIHYLMVVFRVFGIGRLHG
jgi:hypothetical protein